MLKIKLSVGTILLCVTGLMNCEKTVDINERVNRLETLVETLLVENGNLKTRVKVLEDSLEEIKDVTGLSTDSDDNYIVDDMDHYIDEMAEQTPETKNNTSITAVSSKYTNMRDPKISHRIRKQNNRK